MWRTPQTVHSTSLPLLPRLTRDMHNVIPDHTAESGDFSAHSAFSSLADRLLQLERIVNTQREEFLHVEKSYRRHVQEQEERMETMSGDLKKTVRELTTEIATEFLKECHSFGEQEQRFKLWTRGELEDLRTSVSQTKSALLSIPAGVDKLDFSVKRMEMQVSDIATRLNLQEKRSSPLLHELLPRNGEEHDQNTQQLGNFSDGSVRTAVPESRMSSPEREPEVTVPRSPSMGPGMGDGKKLAVLEVQCQHLEHALREQAHRLTMLEIKPPPPSTHVSPRRKRYQSEGDDNAGVDENDNEAAQLRVELVRLRHLVETQLVSLNDNTQNLEARTDRMLSEAMQRVQKQNADMWRSQQELQRELQQCIAQMDATMSHTTQVSQLAHDEAAGRVLDRCTSVTLNANQLAHAQQNKLHNVEQEIARHRNQMAGEIKRVEGSVLNIGKALGDATQQWSTALAELGRNVRAQVQSAETLTGETKKTCDAELTQWNKQFSNRLEDVSARQNDLAATFTAHQTETAREVKACITDLREIEKRVAEKTKTRDAMWARQLEKATFDLRSDIVVRFDEQNSGVSGELTRMEENNKIHRDNVDKHIGALQASTLAALKDCIAHCDVVIAKNKEQAMHAVHEQSSFLRSRLSDMDERIVRTRDDYGERLDLVEKRMSRKVDEHYRDTKTACDGMREAVLEITASVGRIQDEMLQKLSTELAMQQAEHKARLEQTEVRIRETVECLVREEKRARLEHDTTRTRSLQQRLHAFEEVVKAEAKANARYSLERLESAMDSWDARDVVNAQNLTVYKALLDMRLKDMTQESHARFEREHEFIVHVDESVRRCESWFKQELEVQRHDCEYRNSALVEEHKKELHIFTEQHKKDVVFLVSKMDAQTLSSRALMSVFTQEVIQNKNWVEKLIEDNKTACVEGTHNVQRALDEHRSLWQDECKAVDTRISSITDEVKLVSNVAQDTKELVETKFTRLHEEIGSLGEKTDDIKANRSLRQEKSEISETSGENQASGSEEAKEAKEATSGSHAASVKDANAPMEEDGVQENDALKVGSDGVQDADALNVGGDSVQDADALNVGSDSVQDNGARIVGSDGVQENDALKVGSDGVQDADALKVSGASVQGDAQIVGSDSVQDGG